MSETPRYANEDYAHEHAAALEAEAVLTRPVAAVPYHPPAPPTPIRRLPRRVVEIALPAPYDEFHVTGWVNFPKRLARDLSGGDEAAISAALTQIVTGHDLVDEDGQPYPPASDPGFWDAISNDVGAAIIQAVIGQVGKLDPKPPTI